MVTKPQLLKREPITSKLSGVVFWYVWVSSVMHTYFYYSVVTHCGPGQGTYAQWNTSEGVESQEATQVSACCSPGLSILPWQSATLCGVVIPNIAADMWSALSVSVEQYE